MGPSEIGELQSALASAQATTKELAEAVDELTHATRRNRVWTWVLGALVVAVAALGVAQWRSDIADRKSVCRTASETRVVLREMVRKGSIEAGVTTGEALIRTFPNADPDVVALFRANLGELDPALVRIVNELPDRQWVDGTCVDVPVGE